MYRCIGFHADIRQTRIQLISHPGPSTNRPTETKILKYIYKLNDAPTDSSIPP